MRQRRTRRLQLVLQGIVQYITVYTLHSIVQYIKYSTVQYGTVRYGTVRYGTVRYGTVMFTEIKRYMIHKKKQCKSWAYMAEPKNRDLWAKLKKKS